ncbi:hypothetical protein LR021_01345, partial [Candidatus Bipolaricaulota bacterium]|nr:hypothetical protein [Candidatus Bipolaricaulota bacterium]
MKIRHSSFIKKLKADYCKHSPMNACPVQFPAFAGLSLRRQGDMPTSWGNKSTKPYMEVTMDSIRREELLQKIEQAADMVQRR